jgi:thiamine biosynthesis protein ThiI
VALLSSDIWLKSERTRGRMVALVRRALEHALGPAARISAFPGHRLRIEAANAGRAARVFGVAAVEELQPVPYGSLEHLARQIADRHADEVRGKRFAVRTRRRGDHPWRSNDLNRRIGALLVRAGGTVDLNAPEVAVDVRVGPSDAAVLTDVIPGPGGLPIGSQDRVVALASGGIDSPVATWMTMSRGCGADVLHFVLDCAQADHAMAVAYRLWEDWGHGDRPTAHLVDFRPVSEILQDEVPEPMRQVVLKALMMRAAASVAEDAGIPAVVTGEALGQVSSQTLTHLAALSHYSPVPVLRPLLGLDKQEIQRRAREIGTFDLSVRAREVCDLTEGGPVEVAAGAGRLAVHAAAVPEEMWRRAAERRVILPLEDWTPGALTF